MNIDSKTLFHFCPSASQPSAKVVELVSSYLKQARVSLVSFVGEDIVAARADDSDPLACEDQVAVDMYRYVCLTAYRMAIPSLDLVLTPTGFGVVSNQNVAPASKERVAALFESIAAEAMNTLDRIIDALRDDSSWNESPQAQSLLRSIMWRGDDLQGAGERTPDRRDLIRWRSFIEQAEQQLVAFIGRELYDAICTENRTNSLKGARKLLAECCRSYIVAFIRDRTLGGNAVPTFKKYVIRAVEAAPESFPEYTGSTVAEANHYRGYENKRNDTCYFF